MLVRASPAKRVVSGFPPVEMALKLLGRRIDGVTRSDTINTPPTAADKPLSESSLGSTDFSEPLIEIKMFSPEEADFLGMLSRKSRVDGAQIASLFFSTTLSACIASQQRAIL